MYLLKQKQFLMKNFKRVGIDHYNNLKVFIEYSNNIQSIYKDIVDYKPNKKRKLLIILDDMVSNMISNKKINSVVTELSIRSRKLNISLTFIMQKYFNVPKVLG